MEEEIKLENLIEKYKISEQEYEEQLKLIQYTLFMGKTPEQNPKVIIIGGQPGAGKSGFIMFSQRDFKNGNVVTINSDEIRGFYPKADEIAKLYPAYYTKITDEITGEWTSRMLKEAIENRYPFIFEGTLKNERIFDRLKELRENQYQIVVRCLAVPYIESLISMYERYEKQTQMRGWGRMVPIDHHSFVYHAMPTIVDLIEQSNYYDKIEVYIRGKGARTPEVIYSKEKCKEANVNMRSI